MRGSVEVSVLVHGLHVGVNLLDREHVVLVLAACAAIATGLTTNAATAAHCWADPAATELAPESVKDGRGVVTFVHVLEDNVATAGEERTHAEEAAVVAATRGGGSAHDMALATVLPLRDHLHLPVLSPNRKRWLSGALTLTLALMVRYLAATDALVEKDHLVHLGCVAKPRRVRAATEPNAFAAAMRVDHVVAIMIVHRLAARDGHPRAALVHIIADHLTRNRLRNTRHCIFF